MRQIASEVFKNFERSCQRINSTIFLSLIFVPHLKSELQQYFPGDQNCEPSQLHLAWVLVQTEATFDSPLNQLSLFGSGLEDIWWKRYPGPNLALDNPIWIIFALSTGASLAGFVGVLISLPVAAVLGVLVRYYFIKLF